MLEYYMYNRKFVTEHLFSISLGLITIFLFALLSRLSDSRLYKYCKRDARELCHADNKWYQPESMNPENGPTIFICLYRHLTPEKAQEHGNQMEQEERVS